MALGWGRGLLGTRAVQAAGRKGLIRAGPAGWAMPESHSSGALGLSRGTTGAGQAPVPGLRSRKERKPPTLGPHHIPFPPKGATPQGPLAQLRLQQEMWASRLLSCQAGIVAGKKNRPSPLAYLGHPVPPLQSYRETETAGLSPQVTGSGPGPPTTFSNSNEVSLMSWGCLTRLISFDLCSYPVTQVPLPHQRRSTLFWVRPCWDLVPREAD